MTDLLLNIDDSLAVTTLKEVLTQILDTDKTDKDKLVSLIRSALRIKLRWSDELDHMWPGSGDIPCHIELEAYLVSLYDWFLKDCYDSTSEEDHEVLDGMTYVMLDSL